MNEEQTKQTEVQTESQAFCSVVKTPLVDALRRYFCIEEVAKGIVETDKARIQNMVNSCYSNA